MTIRMKLLLFIPLLVIMVGSTTFFLYRSANVVQRSYDGMMERLLLYKQAAQTADSLLQTLYSHLDNPTEASAEATRSLERQLGGLRDSLLASNSAAASIGYTGMMETLIEQEQAAMNASSTSDSLRLYEEAETTALFIREEGSRLVDTELEADRPVFRRIQQENVALSRLGAAVFVTETLLAAVLALWISRSITRPVDALVESAGRIAKGDLQAEPPALAGRDELGAMAEAFRGMLGGLRERARLEQEQSEQRQLLNELELRSLQSQIQPHFLFNSLNALSKLALLEGAERTSDLIVSMSQLIRYNLSQLDRPVSLREELGHVEAYMTIQQARFRDRIAFEREIDESALSAPLPPLTLQPLVENAFVHGVEQMEQGAVISLQIRRDADGTVRIIVADNGKGMPEHARQALLNHSAADHPVRMENTSSRIGTSPLAGAGRRTESAGLGTRNVFRRLELFYGASGLVAIESVLGQGTRVTLTLPSEPAAPSPG
ncbi:sensor histidine kinase [Paenibacillus kobensis]|uniref:sensor histidine kinase n=1 Tax=Paenibacillus kobensis TaxID=59841 RepID=UPI000FD6CF7C|nr:sensor histidine kinase [Paenibacillus kobensis]